MLIALKDKQNATINNQALLKTCWKQNCKKYDSVEFPSAKWEYVLLRAIFQKLFLHPQLEFCSVSENV